ncbi:MAG: class I SAM-dependent methyltransferase [Planctomycetota bacterium]
MNPSDENTANIIRHLQSGQICCDPQWEAAYERFETQEEEIAKFTRRLVDFGFEKHSKDIRVAEVFCGRGNGLIALERLGFTNLEGVDLSEELLQKYQGTASLHLADCRSLPFDAATLDAVIVQGGLHHLPVIPDDLDQVLQEISRVLKPDGRFYVVEPWLTPFLRFAHFVVESPWVRRWYAKGDALAEMIEHERETYEQWLGLPSEILDLFAKCFRIERQKIGWGKIMLIGCPNRSLG